MQREGSTSSTKSKKHLKSILEVLKSIKKFLIEKDIFKEYKNYYKELYALEISKCHKYIANDELRKYFLESIKLDDYFLLQDSSYKEWTMASRYLSAKNKRIVLIKELLKEFKLFDMVKFIYLKLKFR